VSHPLSCPGSWCGLPSTACCSARAFSPGLVARVAGGSAPGSSLPPLCPLGWAEGWVCPTPTPQASAVGLCSGCLPQWLWGGHPPLRCLPFLASRPHPLPVLPFPELVLETLSLGLFLGISSQDSVKASLTLPPAPSSAPPLGLGHIPVRSHCHTLAQAVPIAPLHPQCPWPALFTRGPSLPTTPPFFKSRLCQLGPQTHAPSCSPRTPSGWVWVVSGFPATRRPQRLKSGLHFSVCSPPSPAQSRPSQMLVIYSSLPPRADTLISESPAPLAQYLRPREGPGALAGCPKSQLSCSRTLRQRGAKCPAPSPTFD